MLAPMSGCRESLSVTTPEMVVWPWSTDEDKNTKIIDNRVKVLAFIALLFGKENGNRQSAPNTSAQDAPGFD
jgi:hypothetical protein